MCIGGFRGLACKVEVVYGPSSTERWAFSVGVGMWTARKRGLVGDSSAECSGGVPLLREGQFLYLHAFRRVEHMTVPVELPGY